MKNHAFNLYDASGKQLNLAVRICAVRLSEQTFEAEKKRIHRRHSKRQIANERVKEMFNMARNQKHYTPEFKRQIVDLYPSGGTSYPQPEEAKIQTAVK